MSVLACISVVIHPNSIKPSASRATKAMDIFNSIYLSPRRQNLKMFKFRQMLNKRFFLTPNGLKSYDQIFLVYCLTKIPKDFVQTRYTS